MKTNRLVQFFLLLSVSFLQTCKEPEKEMLVSTGKVENIKISTVDVSGKILDLGEGVSSYGHVYSLDRNAQETGTKKEAPGDPKVGTEYWVTLTNLTPGKPYYVRAYCSRGSETVYGDEISFTTLSDAKPQVTTAEITTFDESTAVCGGDVIEEGGTPVSARGFCWNQSPNPTVDNNKQQVGSGTGTFSHTIEDLQSDKKYYVRAYAANQGGTSYGNERSFTTLPDVPVPPSVTTAKVSAVTMNSAVCGGEVTNVGSSSVTARGVCWSKLPNPLIINSTTTNGTGPGSFISNISGLDPGTKYYVRAYATNSAGTAYGAEDNFITSAVIPDLTTIEVNSITATSAVSGGNIISDGGASITARGVCWSTSSNPTITDSHTNDGLGSGPFTSSLTGLTDYTGNTTYYVRAYATNNIGTGYGNELTFANLAVLTTAGVTGVNITSATCGGIIDPGGGAEIIGRGVCWSTNPNPTIFNSKTTDAPGTGSFVSTLTDLTSNTTYYVRAYATNNGGTSYGNQVSLLTMPSIISSNVYSMTSYSAVIVSNIEQGGGESIIARGVCWSIIPPDIDDDKTEDNTGTGSFTSNLEGLYSDYSYYYRAYATNASGTSYGNLQSFRTPGIVADLSGYYMATVRIGQQLWFRDNIKTTKYRNGDNIATTTPYYSDISEETNPKYQWAYNGNDANVSTYGRLYTWYAVTDPRGVCPTGWHVPTDEDWSILEIYLQNNDFNYDGTIDTDNDRTTNNKTSKALAATTLWLSSTTIGVPGNTDFPGYRNRGSLTAVPGGSRYAHGTFTSIGNSGYWWSSSENNSGNGWARSISYSISSLRRDNWDSKNLGYSVRCIKD